MQAMLTERDLTELTRYTSGLPHIQLLEKYQKIHQDLLIQFLVLRNQSILLGQCLKARFGCGGGNPAEIAFKKGEIDEYEYEVIWALVDCYQAIFTLIQMNWDAIQKHLPKYIDDYLEPQSLKSEMILFLELLKEHYSDSFKRCAEEGYTFTPSHADYRAEIMRRMVTAIDKGNDLLTMTPEEQQKAGLYIKNRRFFLFQAILSICSEAKHTSFYYKEIWRSLSRLAEIHEYWCSPHRGETRARAVKWRNKRMSVGVKGGYKPVRKLYTTFSA